jgi:hypothetical protein
MEDDRRFDVADVLHLREWDPSSKEYTVRDAWAFVTYLSRGPDWGIPSRMVVMSVRKIDRSDVGEKHGGTF